MYKSFEIHRFRGIEEAVFDGFKRINLITGVNNTGKTAVLEAIFLHSGAYNPELASVINANRGITQAMVDVERENDTPWDSVFLNYSSTQTIKLSGKYGDSGWEVRLSHVTNLAEISGLRLSLRLSYERSAVFSTKIPAKILKLEYRRPKGQPQKYFLIVDKDGKRIDPPPPTPPMPTRLQMAALRLNLDEEVQRFARVQLEGADEVILNALKIIEPRLKGLSVVVEAGKAMIHGDVGIPHRRFIPLAMMGDGVNRLCNVLLLIASAPKGVVLIDEVEIGWHHSILEKVWTAINMILEVYNTQLFCTTHSGECIYAAHKALMALEDYPISLYRLDRVDNKTKVTVLDKENIETSQEFKLEIR